MNVRNQKPIDALELNARKEALTLRLPLPVFSFSGRVFTTGAVVSVMLPRAVVAPAAALLLSFLPVYATKDRQFDHNRRRN